MPSGRRGRAFFSAAGWGCAAAFAVAAAGAAPAAGQELLDPSGGVLLGAPEGTGAALAPFPPGAAIDFDAQLAGQAPYAEINDAWTWRLFPASLIYRSYLAGAKETRLGAQLINVRDAQLGGRSTMWDATIGARVGLVRWGNRDPILPQGWQLDAEASAQPRFDLDNQIDFRAADFRVGFPLTFGYGPFQTKLSYYHLSSHLGDEFLLKNLAFPRVNYSREVLVLGQSIRFTPDLRLYGEVGYAFASKVSEPWEFQVGVDYAPGTPTGPWGRPFLAVNAAFREEVDFSGNFVAQAGWAWRGPDEAGRLLRLGATYYNGKSSQYSFFNSFEDQLGAGLWYDF